MSGQHYLVVHEESGDGMEIEHPDGCPRRNVAGGYEQYECGVEVLVDETGLDEHFRPDVLTAGRHPIEYWTETRRNYTGAEEFECGLRFSRSEP